jgi:Transposase DDE domain group 1
VKTTIPEQLAAQQRQIEDRLDRSRLGDCSKPVLSASNIRYEIAERVHGIAYGGIGAFHLLAKRLGLIDAIDQKLHLLKIHLPYHESDHVLNIAYIPLCNGDCLQDIELRRNDVNFLDALGARSIPDPTTAGDFCRRFGKDDINVLQDIYDEIRVGVWVRQPAGFFDRAILDADGTLVATTAEHKSGIDIAYDGTWGYHALLVSLANTGEVMRIVNRPGNRPSHEGAADALDRAVATCFRGGFRKVLLRGDTDFSQTEHLDRWNQDSRIRFIFGYDAKPNLIDQAERLPKIAWKPLQRRQSPPPATGPRQRTPNVKEERVRAREFETLRLRSEDIAELN